MHGRPATSPCCTSATASSSAGARSATWGGASASPRSASTATAPTSSPSARPIRSTWSTCPTRRTRRWPASSSCPGSRATSTRSATTWCSVSAREAPPPVRSRAPRWASSTCRTRPRRRRSPGGRRPVGLSAAEDDHRAFLWWREDPAAGAPARLGDAATSAARSSSTSGRDAITETGRVRQLGVVRSLVAGDRLYTLLGRSGSSRPTSPRHGTAPACRGSGQAWCHGTTSARPLRVPASSAA